MYSIFTLPTDAISTTTGYITSLFVDIWPFVALAIGLPLGFWVLRKIKGVIPK